MNDSRGNYPDLRVSSAEWKANKEHGVRGTLRGGPCEGFLVIVPAEWDRTAPNQIRQPSGTPGVYYAYRLTGSSEFDGCIYEFKCRWRRDPDKDQLIPELYVDFRGGPLHGQRWVKENVNGQPALDRKDASRYVVDTLASGMGTYYLKFRGVRPLREGEDLRAGASTAVREILNYIVDPSEWHEVRTPYSEDDYGGHISYVSAEILGDTVWYDRNELRSKRGIFGIADLSAIIIEKQKSAGIGKLT